MTDIGDLAVRRFDLARVPAGCTEPGEIERQCGIAAFGQPPRVAVGHHLLHAGPGSGDHHGGHRHPADAPGALDPDEVEPVTATQGPQRRTERLGLAVGRLERRGADRTVCVDVDQMVGQQVLGRSETAQGVAPSGDDPVGCQGDRSTRGSRSE
nr:hypothetical protein [Nocardia arthritidis]